MAKALIIVDVQNDFVEGGSLGVTGGKAVAAKLAEALKSGAFDHYDHIVTTQDWHIDPGTHFSDTPDFVDSWPAHCVAGTLGSSLVKELDEALEGRFVIRITKGQYEAAYSGFDGQVDGHELMGGSFGLPLSTMLGDLDVDSIDITGIATDYCVRATALDGAARGFTTTVLKDFCAGINPEKVAETYDVEFPAHNVSVA